MAQFLISGFHHPFPLDISWRSLPHDIMVTKLEAFRFVKESLKLISDYLSYRKERTKTGSAYNNWANVIHGIQGSILDPLLFNTFINDTFLVLEKSDICNFAEYKFVFPCQQPSLNSE